MNCFRTFSLSKHKKLPCINPWKNAFCGHSNKILDSLIGSFLKTQSNHNNGAIVKLGSFDQNILSKCHIFITMNNHFSQND